MHTPTLQSTINSILTLEDIDAIKAELMRIEEPFVAADDMDSLEMAADIITRTNRALLANCISGGSSSARAQFVRTSSRTRHLIALYYRDHCAELEILGINSNNGTELVVRIDKKKMSVPTLTSEDENGWTTFKLTHPAT